VSLLASSRRTGLESSTDTARSLKVALSNSVLLAQIANVAVVTHRATSRKATTLMAARYLPTAAGR
jgi:broad specificity phosphatase PhoE